MNVPCVCRCVVQFSDLASLMFFFSLRCLQIQSTTFTAQVKMAAINILDGEKKRKEKEKGGSRFHRAL